jgi:phage baseplate assembly protein gpV
LQANPGSIPRADSTITLSAFVANAQGQPLQGAPVTFESDRGTLSTNGVVFTQTNGVATNTLTVRQADLPLGVNTIRVTASTPSEGGGLLQDTTEINVR